MKTPGDARFEVILVHRRAGKDAYYARLRDEALSRGESVAVYSPKEGGGIHTCIVKPLRRK